MALLKLSNFFFKFSVEKLIKKSTNQRFNSGNNSDHGKFVFPVLNFLQTFTNKFSNTRT